MTNFFTQRLAGTSEAETSVSRKLKLNFLTIGEDQKSKLSGVACLIYSTSPGKSFSSSVRAILFLVLAVLHISFSSTWASMVTP